MRFKTAGLAAVLFGLGVASSASAADMAVKAPPAPAAITPLPSWTGFYVGINGGGAGTENQSMTYTDLAINAYFPATVNASATSGLAGFHAGYNYQFAPNWLLGVEGDWDWTSLKSSGTQNLVCAGAGRVQCGGINLVFTDNASLNTNINWLASVRGRLGYASNQWLLYATGGVAFAEMDFGARVNCTNIAPSFCGGGAQSIDTRFKDTRVGAVVGGGIEYKPASNWIFGLEYLYYHFDSASAGGNWFVVSSGAPAPFFECAVAGQNCAKFSFGDVGIHTGRFRLSYQFN